MTNFPFSMNEFQPSLPLSFSLYMCVCMYHPAIHTLLLSISREQNLVRFGKPLKRDTVDLLFFLAGDTLCIVSFCNVHFDDTNHMGMEE